MINLQGIKFTSASSKHEALQNFAEIAHELNIIDSKAEFLQGLLNREAEFSTGIGNGIAIPHCKSTTVNKPNVLVQKFTEPVEWESLDGSLVKIALCLAVPESEGGTTHLRLLSKIARSLMKQNIVDSLLNAENEEDIYKVLSAIVNEKDD